MLEKSLLLALYLIAILILLVVLRLGVACTWGASARATETCLSLGDGRINGVNRICYYSCPSGQAAITIRSYQLCPLTIRR